eukprot:NODE_909_length_1238_cov_537.275021_g694_i0.p1 GENE.NODE_909_length_1238_cov_537.275021_g694_i0~~NODE_909_length_1238_cov_537.275021_g694_i0.p1  ORF type:complete len:232 (+),score=59.86 NODE_909_length_1238_cov_537.275021_g694_i0:283-978(+)
MGHFLSVYFFFALLHMFTVRLPCVAVAFGTRGFHVSAPALVFPHMKPYENLHGHVNDLPATNIEAQPMKAGEGMWASGIGTYFAAIERRVNIRRRPPSRFTQMTGGRRSQSFSIQFERGYVERDFTQGARVGMEPGQMMKRKMKTFKNIADAEAFAVYQGWEINRSNPSNMRFNPRVGLNRREWKQRFEMKVDTFKSASGKMALYPDDPFGHGRGQSKGKAVVTKRPSIEE